MAYATLKRNDANVLISYVIEDSAANLTGATVYFVMKRQNGPLMTYAAATIANVATKTVTYTLKDVDTVLSGIFHAEFAVKFADGKERSYPQSGYLQIMIQPNADDEKTTYVMDNVAERVSEMQLLKGEMQAQLNNIVTMGDSSIEVANARINDDGRVFATLKERLDSKDTEFEGLSTEVDNSRLTNPGGWAKIVVSTAAGDILNSILVAGGGVHTFYAVGGSKNLPPSNKSIRGMAQVTNENPTIAYVWAIDYQNKMFTNYNNGGTWSGWQEIAQATATSSLIDTKVAAAKTSLTTSINNLQTDLYDQTVLWEWKSTMGVNTALLDSTNITITPNKALSNCKNGWILVWSDVDALDDNVNDFHFAYSYIPKYMGTKFSGKSSLFQIPTYTDGFDLQFAIKTVYVHNTKLVAGYDNAWGGSTGVDVGLRAVLEW